MKRTLSSYGSVFSKIGLLVFLLLFVTDDTILFGTNSNSIFVTIKYGTIIFLFFYFLYIALSKHLLTRSRLFIAIGMSVIVLLSGFVNSDIRSGYLYKIVLIVLGLAVSCTISRDVFLDVFTDLIVLITLIAILGLGVAFIYPSALSLFPVVTNTADALFYNLGLTCIPLDSMRLYGPFREPGVYQIFLNISLIYVLSQPVVNRFYFVLLTVAVVLTGSTTGFIALFVIIMYYLTLGGGKNRGFVLLLIMVGFLVLVLFTNLLSSEGYVFNKLLDRDRHTTIARMASFYCNLDIIKDYPILGCGLSKLEALFPTLSYRRFGFASEHNTNVLLIQFASHGILYGILWIWFLGRFFVHFSTKYISKLLLFMALMVICVGENLTWSVFYYILLFYGVKSTNKL